MFTIGVGVHNNHFEYWSSYYLAAQCLTPVLVQLHILHQKLWFTLSDIS
jgi:hypothetical protein